MTTTSTLLASGPGWRVQDVLCTSGPADRPYEEMHGDVCIAVVTSGTFRYRTRQGDALMTPASLLLGNAGACYECGHEHATGDRCLSFHFTQRFHEAVIAAAPGARNADFNAARLACSEEFARVVADTEVARDEGDTTALEEAAVRLAGGVATALGDRPAGGPSPAPRDMRRIADALSRIESAADEKLPLSTLAREVAMSPYHFLRTFRTITSITPHQYVLRLRLHRAAKRLRQGHEPVSTIALDCGFDDLSTFNRRFRRVMAVSPGQYRLRKRS